MSETKITVSDLADRCGFEVLHGGEALEKQVTGGFCGDLLSWVMGRAAPGCAWITVMGNENAVAVAVLIEAACIILVQGAEIDEKAFSKACENNVAVLKSKYGAFETAISVGKAIKI